MTRPKLWLTYAWVDNDDMQIDFMVQEIERAGIEVHYDRVRLVPGQRLWNQIERQIQSSDECDAWAIVVSKASLASQPCQEELAYALDRAVSARGQGFPIIGIFAEKVDSELVPAAIRTRLYVDIRSPNWVDQVKAGVERRAPTGPATQVNNYVVALHWANEFVVVECRPRAGRWMPCVVVVPAGEKDLISMAITGPTGHPPSAGMVPESSGLSPDGRYFGRIVHNQATALDSFYVSLRGTPSELLFGPQEFHHEMPQVVLDQIRSYFARRSTAG